MGNQFKAELKQEEQYINKGCNFCNYGSDENKIYLDSISGDYYLEVETSHWDEYNHDWDYERVYINYCPWCGRDLSKQAGKWIKISGVLTPGGDPCYCCSNCGGGEHLNGVEFPQSLDRCPDCGSYNTYS